MATYSNAFTAHFSAPHDPPAAVLAQWRATRPTWLPSRYSEIDDSYNSVTWQYSHTQLLMKLVTFGGLLGGSTVYRITALFEEDGASGSAITVNGQADKYTLGAIKEAAEVYVPGGTY